MGGDHHSEGAAQKEDRNAVRESSGHAENRGRQDIEADVEDAETPPPLRPAAGVKSSAKSSADDTPA